MNIKSSLILHQYNLRIWVIGKWNNFCTKLRDWQILQTKKEIEQIIEEKKGGEQK